MLQILKKWIVTIFSDVRSAIVAIIVVAAMTALGGIVVFSKNLTLFLYDMLQSPTPIWATILLVLLSCFLTYLRNQAQLRPLSTDELDKQFQRTLDNDDVQMLRVIATIGSPFDKEYSIIISEPLLSKRLNLSPQQAKYHLDKLNNAGYIYYNFDNELCGITKKGRAFLGNNKLLP